ncbi:MAG: hypothetical protein O6934_05755 [SAR324 cluster bacterium]|nr:hypothetical protein [SAR324 cluster bacterium]
MADAGRYFNAVENKEAEFDAERFLTEASSLFQSEDIMREVGWRIAVLRELSAQPDFKDVSEGLRDRLTQIFSQGGEEQEILGKLQALTEVKRADGGMIDLRRLMKGEKRILSEKEYRSALGKKLHNTEFLMLNLMVYFPESHVVLNELTKTTQQLTEKVKGSSISTRDIRKEEEDLRDSPAFEAYEEFKTRFLRDWLGQFSSLTEEQIKGLSAEEIQEKVQEHQRHQLTQLLRTQVVLSNTDMSDRLGMHDTLEGNFSEEEFWQGANVFVRKAFRQLILAVIQSFGMPLVIQSFGMSKGMRYAFFQIKDNDEHCLLLGLGVKELPESEGAPLELVPYIKPFTRKAGFLLEIRKRELAEPDQYYHELRHYVLPFLFAFDQIPNFTVHPDLIAFFTSSY